MERSKFWEEEADDWRCWSGDAADIDDIDLTQKNLSFGETKLGEENAGRNEFGDTLREGTIVDGERLNRLGEKLRNVGKAGRLGN